MQGVLSLGRRSPTPTPSHHHHHGGGTRDTPPPPPPLPPAPASHNNSGSGSGRRQLLGMDEPISSSSNGNTPISVRQQQLTRQVLALLGPGAASRYSEVLMALVLARGRATLDVQLAFPDSDDDDDGEGEGGREEEEEARIHADLAVGYKVEAYACMDQVRLWD
jgi:hypothetical protein